MLWYSLPIFYEFLFKSILGHCKLKIFLIYNWQKLAYVWYISVEFNDMHWFSGQKKLIFFGQYHTKSVIVTQRTAAAAAAATASFFTWLSSYSRVHSLKFSLKCASIKNLLKPIHLLYFFIFADQKYVIILIYNQSLIINTITRFTINPFTDCIFLVGKKKIGFFKQQYNAIISWFWIVKKYV